MRCNTLLFVLWMGFLLIPQSSKAQSVIAGTWKIDPSRTSFPTAPEVLLLKGSKYQCKSCLPPIAVRADGADHPVKGSLCFDTIRVSALDNNTMEQIDKYQGRTVVASRIKVSADGLTALFDSEEYLSADAPPVTSSLVLKRVGKMKRSTRAHALSGSWMILGYANPSENASIFRVERGTIVMTPATGGSMRETGSLDQLGKYTFVETVRRDGKAMRMRRFMIDPAQTDQMVIIDEDLVMGITLVLHGKRQADIGPQ